MNWDDSQEVDELPAPPRRPIPEADLRLLELAGRAIGAVRMEVVEGESWVNLHFADSPTIFAWNPQRHSDDMLELAVSLDIEIHPDRTIGKTSTSFSINHRGHNTFERWSEHSGDGAAATRLAVLRAAAEIGKQSQ